MIIVLGSQKGGVGKSTLAVSIAAYLMALGKRVLIVDADDQKSVLTWYNNRPENLPHMPVTGASGNIKAMLKEHEKSYDFVIADCAGRDSAEMRSGLMAADVFISLYDRPKWIWMLYLIHALFLLLLKISTSLYVGI
jgi:chromosome partitioning protein